ncbi:protein TONSOKU-like [Prosopis cineraria]|uniref:protein TONSOKU-like n=1 Tax=Prosopis cineraria TaxID=364024 RepID=UPI00240F22DE|nr:protein TONSOKU-like [Prosopis cineraria]
MLGSTGVGTGSNSLASLLMKPQCCLKVLDLRKCQLGLAGILRMTKALAENNYIEELNLAVNAVPNELQTLQLDFSTEGRSQFVGLVRRIYP